jgi:hypothetical protein
MTIHSNVEPTILGDGGTVLMTMNMDRSAPLPIPLLDGVVTENESPVQKADLSERWKDVLKHLFEGRHVLHDDLIMVTGDKELSSIQLEKVIDGAIELPE